MNPVAAFFLGAFSMFLVMAGVIAVNVNPKSHGGWLTIFGLAFMFVSLLGV